MRGVVRKARSFFGRVGAKSTIVVIVIVFSLMVFGAISFINEAGGIRTDLPDGLHWVEVEEIIAAGKIRLSGNYFVSGEQIAEMKLKVGDRLKVLVMDMEVRRISLRR